MNSQLHDIAYLIQFRDYADTRVSPKPIIWHLYHSLKVINIIYAELKKSNPDTYKKHYSWMRAFVFSLGYIPRGKGKSPTAVLPPDLIPTQDVLMQLDMARDNLNLLDKMDAHVNFKHPMFGQLNRKQTKRFLEIHTKHHLKIVADILRNKRSKRKVT